MRIVLLILIVLHLTACVEHKEIKTMDWLHANQHIMAKYGPAAHATLKPLFELANIHYPPKQLSMLTFKKERVMELWANNGHAWKLIKKYPLTAFSGHAGPKLKSRDRQIPEGIYSVQYLYPFSHYHLGMRINYPNRYDRSQAKREGRKNLGGDIFIHGKNQSVGCLAIGDKAIEELYVLVHDTGVKNSRVIIASNDIRHYAPTNLAGPHPKWTRDLDHRIQLALRPFKDQKALA